MYTNDDLLGFFESLMGYEKNQCDVTNAIAVEVDDPTIKDTLFRLVQDELRHMGIVQQMLDLVGGHNL